ncbi:MAG: type III-B CRISPR module RAMP protein Cmr4 [Crenarchaeota archaeon]|nr:type III-B CRISPR module RAMP protein Cmr4 [Thermoproteota archaeon]
MSSGSPASGRDVVPVLASALTNLHPGAGRSPGVVDLPVVRDPFGVFYIPGSAFKGALKTSLALKKNCVNGDSINCNGGDNCRMLCCLLGGETGESTEAPSMLSIGDLYPLLVPVPSLTHGFLYVTSPMLVARAQEIVNVAGRGGGGLLGSLVGWLEKGVEKLGDGIGYVLLGAGGDGKEKVALTLTLVEAEKVPGDGVPREELGRLGSIYGKHPLAGHTVVVPDRYLVLLIERSLVRMTRVRLDRSRKTVARGFLWTEEYIPQFTLFAGYIANTGFRGKYCSSNIEDPIGKLLELAETNGGNVFPLVVGGKEAVGKGLVKILVDTGSGSEGGR